ncbi:aspartyl protease family protein [Rhodophyticola sp.]|jgi:hypothetical protein|uniref:aspartyl protease family protein n=1 Tax=Rhodophyticola sp. TaxID=2680032 RepID=UPI003D280DB9
MMAPANVRYAGKDYFGTQLTKNRLLPFTMITLHGSGNVAIPIWGLLDTGADHLMLNSGEAKYLNIDLNQCPKRKMLLANGCEEEYSLATIQVSIKGYRNKVDALFGVVGTPLIGRTTIQRTLKFGLDEQGWLYAKSALALP